MRRLFRVLPGILLMTVGALADPADLAVDRQFLLTTYGQPGDYVVTPPSLFDGVARLNIVTSGGTFLCSGSLLASGQLLTAAHCLTDDAGAFNTLSMTATFFTSGSTLAYSASSYAIHPLWNGDNYYDLAVVSLDGDVPIAGYHIYRDEYYGVVTMAGYGRSGTGTDGHTLNSGTLRAGQNTYDIYWTVSGGQKAYYGFDFDNGAAAQNSMGSATPLGQEVLTVPGDSGGPSFYNGQIVGVHSWYGQYGGYDLDSTLNGTFGEVGGDVMLSLHTGWLDQTVVPEPAGYWFGAACAAGLFWFGRRRKRAVSPAGSRSDTPDRRA